MKRAIAIASLAILMACGSTGAPPPVIASFTATPSDIAKGESSTLAWTVSGANLISIDRGIGEVTGSSTVVAPPATTTYTLTAKGQGGSATAAVTITVGLPKVPVISSFIATPASISRGKSTVLSWSVTSATAFSISPTLGAVTGNQTSASPAQTTTYTLTATGAGGSATATTTVTVTDPVLRLEYVEPPATTGGLRVVRNLSSSDARMILDVVVGPQPLNAFGLALNLPIDVARARFPTDGLILGNALNPGAAPQTALAKVPASGLFQGVLMVALARKKLAAGDGDVQLPAGTRLFSLTFDLVPSAPTGVVFDGVTPGPKFDAALLSVDGRRVVDKTGVAIGTLSVVF